MQSPKEIKSRLFSLLNKGIKYDLERMFKAASLCGDPHKSYPSVHIAGTNGKGSTCAYLESVLRRAGYKTGLYTSPHITDFEERFRINGVNIGEDVWFDVYKDQEKIINGLGLTFFEAATLMAFEIFRRQGVQYAVFEAGMGGRLDATNIIVPKVSVITKIALDHTEYLGVDVTNIAVEKLGIVKRNVPLVMLEPDNPQIKKIAVDKCVEFGSELTFVDINEANDVVCGDAGVSFCLNGCKYDLSLFGVHQVQNALLALSALIKTGDFNYHANRQIIYEGMKAASIRGRFQIVDINGRTVIFDVGHNPDAAAILVNAIEARFPNKRVSFVIGIMKDKDTVSIIDILTKCKTVAAFYFAKPDTSRAAEPTDLCAQVQKESFSGKTAVCANVKGALLAAIDDADNCGVDVICVTGSFYTVAEALPG